MTPALEGELARLTEGTSGWTRASFADGFRRSVEGWSERLTGDRELASIELGIAHCARILAADHPSSPQYAEAQREDRELRDRHAALLRERAQAARPPA